MLYIYIYIYIYIYVHLGIENCGWSCFCCVGRSGGTFTSLRTHKLWYIAICDIDTYLWIYDSLKNKLLCFGQDFQKPAMRFTSIMSCHFIIVFNYTSLDLFCVWKQNRHDDVIKWKHFPRNWPFVRGIHRSRWIPHTKASDAELWCVLWSASE